MNISKRHFEERELRGRFRNGFNQSEFIYHCKDVTIRKGSTIFSAYFVTLVLSTSRS